MKEKDEEIKSLVKQLKKECETYLNYVKDYNTCAYSDRMIEKIVSCSNDLKVAYDDMFVYEVENERE